MRRLVFSSIVAALVPLTVQAQDDVVQLFAPSSLTETGALGYILPRFSLKTQVKVDVLADPAEATVVLGDEGRALFEGAGQVWHLDILAPEHPPTMRFVDWLTSEIGLRTVTAYAPEGAPMFTLATAPKVEVRTPTFDGSPDLGHKVSRTQCIRCHAVDEASRKTTIGSTPSFMVLRALPDWDYRFSAFYTLNPHPSFTVIPDVTEPFPIDRPSPIVPIELTLDELDAILAYVAAMQPADLGAPLDHQ